MKHLILIVLFAFLSESVNAQNSNLFQLSIGGYQIDVTKKVLNLDVYDCKDKLVTYTCAPGYVLSFYGKQLTSNVSLIPVKDKNLFFNLYDPSKPNEGQAIINININYLQNPNPSPSIMRFQLDFENNEVNIIDDSLMYLKTSTDYSITPTKINSYNVSNSSIESCTYLKINNSQIQTKYQSNASNIKLPNPSVVELNFYNSAINPRKYRLFYGKKSYNNFFTEFGIFNSSVTGKNIPANFSKTNIKSIDTITVFAPVGSDLSKLVMYFKTDSLASVKVNNIIQISSQTINDFTNPVKYTITSEAGTVLERTVIVKIPETGKTISEFKIETPAVKATIIDTHITLTVPYNTDVRELVVSFVVSSKAVVKVNGATIVSSVTKISFMNGPVNFVVIAEDGSTKTYIVEVKITPASSLNQFLAFSFKNILAGVKTTITGNNINVVIPYAIEMSNLVAKFTTSPFTTVSINGIAQESGYTKNSFNKSVVYSVKAQNGDVANYTVNVISEALINPSKAFYSFDFYVDSKKVNGGISGSNINLLVPYGTNIKNLVANFVTTPKTIVKIGSIVQTSDVTSNDFSSPITYSVIDSLGAKQDYVVKVVEAKNSDCIIRNFKFNSNRLSPLQTWITVGQTTRRGEIINFMPRPLLKSDLNFEYNITFDEPYGAKFYINNENGKEISGKGTNLNFNNRFFGLKVVAEDSSYNSYLFTIEPCVAQLNSFKINNVVNNVSYNYVVNPVKYIDISVDTIFVTFPANTDLKIKRPIEFASYTDVYLMNEKTSQRLYSKADNLSFDSTRTFLIKYNYQDLYNQQSGNEKVVIVSGYKSYDAQLSSFSLNGYNANVTIDERYKKIDVRLPYGSQLNSSVIANFTSSPGAIVKLNNVVQQSGVTTNNFTINSNYNYVVISESGRSVQYKLYISIQEPSKNITSFSFTNPNVTGVINGTNITVTVPYGANISNLVANFSAPNSKSVTVNSVSQVSGTTSNNFSSPVSYVVTAVDNSTQTYVVTVNITPISTAKNITAFSFDGLNPVVIASISGTNITATVPYGTNVSNLAPTFSLSNFATAKVGSTIQSSGTSANNFTNPVTYTITAQDGSTQNYTVTVTIAPPKSTEKVILSYGFNTLNPVVTATISGTNITATVPFGTNISNLVPTFTISPKATITSGGVTQVSGVTAGNFTTSKYYFVTAEDGSTKLYSVTITIAKNTQKEITAFSFNELNPTVIATISGTNITATVPNATNVKTLVASFTKSIGSTVKLGNIVQLTGSNSNDFTNPLTYVVTAEDGSTQNYIVTIKFDKPNPPVVPVPTTVCEGQTIPSLSAPGSSLKWYSDAGLTNVVGTGSPFTTGKTKAGIYTFYVTQTGNGLESSPTTVRLTIQANPDAPISGGDQVSMEESTIPVLSASSPNAITWYSDVDLTTNVGTGTTLSTGKTVAGSYTFYAMASNNGCNSPATPIKLTINTPPAAWTVVTPNATTSILYGVAAPSKSANWAIGSTGVLLSNTGTTWSTSTSGLSTDINAISFNGTSNGWAVGKSGKILQYDGTKWTVATNNSTTALLSVCAVDATTAFAAGQSGRLLKYSNGVWSTVSNSSVTSNLNSMSFAGTNKGIIVGASGTIMTYNGTAWASTTQGSADLFGVQLLDANTGWAVGASGTILKYNGSSWSTVTSGVTNTLRSVYFTSAINGYAVGDGGTILKYDGSSWTKATSGTTNNLNGVAFSDANTGWAVGASGTIVAYKGVTNTVALPTITPNVVCFGESIPAFNAVGTNIVWYSDAAATVQVATGNSYTPLVSTVGTYTYFVTQTVNSVKSLPVAVSLTIKQKPVAPTISADVSINLGATLAPFTASGKNISWYTNANLVNKIATGTDYTPASQNVGTTSYYATQTDNGCTSIASVVKLTITSVKSSEKQITSFSFNGLNPVVNATISGTNITATVPNGTNRTNLIATFNASPKATVKVGQTLQLNGTTSNDFTNAVTYVVSAEDGTTQNYTVTITEAPAPKSSEKQITAFSFNGLNPVVTASIVGTTITATVPNGTNRTSLIATFTASAKATVKVGQTPQVSGTTPNDFTNAVTYTVTAEDGTTQNYTVTISETPVTKSSEKAITAFSFEGLNPVVTGTINGTTITATVPNGTNRSNLIATFTASAKATVKVGQTPQVSGTTPNDFTNAVTYTVTAEDGTTQNYTVIISEAPAPKSSEKAITAFSFNGLNPVVNANISGTNITATVPNGTNRTSLIATFTASAKATVKVGQTLQVSGTTQNDFTNVVTYVVTAEDGTTQNYVVTITEAPAPKSSEKAITAFSFNGLNPVVNATISGTNITATVPNGTNRTSLIATFTASAKATVKVGQTPQVSGITPNDFTNAVTYTVTAEDGTTQNYTVIISEAPAPKSSEKAITAFSFNGLNPVVNATISGTNITATVPNGTNRSNLIATFTASAKASVKVGQTLQVSGTTVNDFTNAVTYIITAEDGTTQNYVVTITEAPAPKSSEKAITAFSFEGLNPVVTGTINGTTITATVPNGTNRSNLIATFTASAKATVKVGQTPQVSGITPNDFTNAVTYTVTAEDGTTQNYTVIISEAPATKSSEKAITAFSFNGLNPVVNATISGANFTATVPNGTNRSNLIATFTASAKATVKVGQTPQVSGITPNDFTNAVTYIVTAEDGTNQNYVVTITEAPAPKSSEKAITAFSFEGLNPVVTGTINGTTITATVPNGTNRSNLVATFTASAKAIVKVGQTLQLSGTTENDFTNAVTYTVTAEDGTTKDYTVIVIDTTKNEGFLSFQVNGINGVVVNNDSIITITVPDNTDITKLVATFKVQSTAVVSVGDSVQISGQSVNDYTYGVTFVITLPNGEIKKVKVIIIKEQQSGLLDLQNECFVYPNPTKGIIFIKGESGSLSIIVKDLQGRKIYENQNSNYFGEKISIDLENIPSQILFVHIINNNIEINRKIEVIK